jgi:MinD-like ATPase involved in chromosome partitioning or flagellar assembly
MPPPVARAVVNRAIEGTAANKVEIEKATMMPVIGMISNAWQDTHKAIEQGQVLRQSAPRSPATQDFRRLVNSISGAHQDAEKRKRTFFNFFR